MSFVWWCKFARLSKPAASCYRTYIVTNVDVDAFITAQLFGRITNNFLINFLVIKVYTFSYFEKNYYIIDCTMKKSENPNSISRATLHHQRN